MFSLEAAARTGFRTLFNLVVLRLQADLVDEILWFHRLGKPLGVACSHGHLEIVRRTHELHPDPLAVDGFAKAAAHGHLELVQWLCDHRNDQLCIDVPPTQVEGAMNCCFKPVAITAVENGHVAIVQWLFEVRLLITVKTLRSVMTFARVGDV